MAAVDELFGSAGEGARPQTGRAYALLALGLAVSVLGLVCTTAPGGMLVLGAWLLVDREGDRVDSGYLPATAAPEVARARRWTAAGLLVVLALFALQGLLLCSTDVYGGLLRAFVAFWQESAR